MSKQSLLLVDGDTRSLRVLEVSLRKAGFTVTPASSVSDAIDKLEIHAPDLIISETTFPDGDGFELRRRVRGSPEWAEIPFVFLTASTAIENKIKGLELGVDDYLTKPIYIKEIITRINILLQKKQRTKFEERRDGRTRFAGRVTDMPVVDVIQTIEISRKSGVIQFVGERGRQAAIYFRDGKVIDAEAGALQGEDAVYRLLTWGEGEFEVIFRTVRRRDVITASSQGLLMEGMRRLDEWSRLLEQLPSLTHRFEVDVGELSGRLGEVPDDNNRILRLIDGRRTLLEVIDASDCGDLETLQAISRLYFEELLVDLDHGTQQRRDSKPMPVAVVDVLPTPIEEVASGPHVIDDDAANVPAEADVISEEPIGPMLGSYRPSSLRLIDEAVAAAQAIEPSLFDDDEPRDGTVTEAVDSDEAIPKPHVNGESARITAPVVPNEDPPASRVADLASSREDSGLRMIGSHGRDRAEASGEFAVIRPPPEASVEPQREMVTIMPRRITREVPIIDPSTLAPRTQTTDVSAAAAAATTDATPAVARTITPPSGTPVSPAPAVARTITPTSGTPAVARSITPPQGSRTQTPPTGTPAPSRTQTPPKGTPVSSPTPPKGSPIASRTILGTGVAEATARGTGEIPSLRSESNGAQKVDSGLIVIPKREEPADDDMARPRPSDKIPIIGRPVEPLPPPPKLTTTGTGVRRRTGPGIGVLVLLVLAAVFAVVAVYLKVRKAPHHEEAVTNLDAGAAVVPDAGRRFTITPLGVDAAVAVADAGEIEMEPEHMKRDAGVAVAPVDAGAKAVDAGPEANDRNAVAKQLMEQALAAIQEGSFQKGLDLADESLKHRRAARTLLVRATAQQRLQRYDDALASIEQALEVYKGAMGKDYPGGWEQKGQLLWSIRRYDDARAALEHFLELEPTGGRADRVRKQLEQQP